MAAPYDAAVIGAGPVGCYVASGLRRKGIRTLVLEEHPAVGRPVHCAGVLGAAAFEEFDLPKKAVINNVDEIKVVAPGLESFTIKKPHTMAYVIDRAIFDREIAERALDAGAEIRLGCRVEKIEENREAVSIRYRRGEVEEAVQARVCILATGSRSNLPYQVNISRPATFIYGAQVEAELDAPCGVEVHLGREYAPGFFAWVVPLEGRKARIGLCTYERAPFYLRTFLDSPLIRSRIVSADERPTHSRIPLGMIRRSYSSRFAAVGDAASQVKPVTGGGIRFGLKCGRILADAIDPEKLDGKWRPGYFKEYDRRWKRELGLEIRAGYFFRGFLATWKDRQYDEMVTAINRYNSVEKLNDRIHYDRHRDIIVAAFKDRDLRKILYAFLKKVPAYILRGAGPPGKALSGMQSG
jgi:geranylgeranyl reductase family protein